MGNAPNPQKQKRAKETIRSLADDAGNVWIIHYSCESFYDRKDGSSPRITSIAVRKLSDAQTRSFSIHQVAERKKLKSKQLEKQYNVLELEMLAEFSKFLETHQNNRFLHWNMRDSNYGFQAIEHRTNVLGGDPTVLPDDKKLDLSRLLIDIYGVGYSNHPRLQSLMTLNSITEKDFLSGAEEANAFERKDYVALHQSTLRKVDILANIFHRANEQQLKTKTTWWEMHGGLLRGPVQMVVENKVLSFSIGLAGLILTLISLKK